LGRAPPPSAPHLAAGPSMGSRTQGVKNSSHPRAGIPNIAWDTPEVQVLGEAAIEMGYTNTSVANQQWYVEADAEVAQMSNFLCRMVPYEDLSKLASRLTRRTAGLGPMWEEFCTTYRSPTSDPARADPRVLLHFICRAVARASDRVAVVKGPFQPFMGVMVYIAQRHWEANTEDTSPDWSKAHQTLGSGNHFDDRSHSSVHKEDSTRSGSVDSKASKGGASADSSTGAAPKSARNVIASVSWLGPDPSADIEADFQ